MAIKLVFHLFGHENMRIRKQLGKLRREVSPSNLHSIRVAIKRMDALLLWYLCFLKPIEAEQFTAWFAKLRSLYKKVGHVRSLQIMLDLGENAQLWLRYPQVKTELQQQQVHHQEKLLHFLRKFRYPTVRKVSSFLKNYDGLTEPHFYKITQGFAERQQNEAVAVLTFPASDQWHMARRLLKSNYFVAKMITRTHFSFDGGKANTWGILAERLGQWHDWHVLGNRLAKLTSLNDLEQFVAPQIEKLEQEVMVLSQLLRNEQA